MASIPSKLWNQPQGILYPMGRREDLAAAFAAARAAAKQWDKGFKNADYAAERLNEHLPLDEQIPSASMLYKREQGKQDISRILAAVAEKVYKCPPNALLRFYNGDEDGGYDELPSYLRTTEITSPLSFTPISALKVPMGEPVFRRNAPVVTRRIRAFLNGAPAYVQLTNDTHNLKAGMVLVFLESEQPLDHAYIWFESVGNPGINAWGYLDDQNRICGNGEPLDAKDWRPIAYAQAICAGIGDTLQRLFMTEEGIGPSSRLQFSSTIFS